MNKAIIITFSLLFLILFAFYLFVYLKLEIDSGYNAKILYSYENVSCFSQEKTESEYFSFSILLIDSNKVDREQKTIKSSDLRMHSKTAIFRKGLGCTLITNIDPPTLSNTGLLSDSTIYSPEIWPAHEVLGTKSMQEAINLAFDKDNED